MDTDIPAYCNTARVTRQSDTFAWSCGCHSVTVGVEICAYLLDVESRWGEVVVCLSLPKLMILIQN